MGGTFRREQLNPFAYTYWNGFYIFTGMANFYAGNPLEFTGAPNGGTNTNRVPSLQAGVDRMLIVWKRVMEDAEAGAKGSLVISKHIPCETDPGIEVLVGRIAHIGIRDVLEACPEGRTHSVEEVIVSLDGVGLPVVAQPKIEREPAVNFPVILNVGGNPNVALSVRFFETMIRFH